MAVVVTALLCAGCGREAPAATSSGLCLWSGMRLARKREWGYVNLSITIPGTGAGASTDALPPTSHRPTIFGVGAAVLAARSAVVAGID